MSKSPPLISIVTVTYQAAKTLERTIRSVSTQPAVYEFIIIDGGSTDGTVDIIQAYQHLVNHWVSEPDQGIYDAMNKGLAKATGSWVYFLGADDTLKPGILSELAPVLTASNATLIFGDVQYDYGKYFRSGFSLLTILHNTVHHQGSFYKRTLFESFSYDASLKVIADYDLNLLIYLKNLPYERVDKVIALCSGGGSSYDLEASLRETNVVRKKHLGTLPNAVLKKILGLKYFITYVLLRKV